MKKKKQKAPAKPPRIKRNGQPYNKAIKPTAKEHDARVEQVLAVIAAQPNLSPYKLHKLFCPKFKVTWPTIDRYVARAREKLRERLNRPREVIRSNAVAFYESIISDTKVFPQVRLKAQALLVELLGAATPKKIELSGPEGGPLQTESKQDLNLVVDSLTVEELRAIIDKLVKQEQ